MENIFIILSKQDFTSLLRFGTISIQRRALCSAAASIKEIEVILFNMFCSLPFFQGDEEYLILKFQDNGKKKDLLCIENVQAVIPLTKAAKNSYELKFDSNLIFSDNPFTNLTEKLISFFEIQDRKRGVQVAEKLLLKGHTSLDIDLSKEIENLIEYKNTGLKSFDIHSDFLTHLLLYDRYEPFPNTFLGYFYDIGEIFAHSMGVESNRNSKQFEYLEKNKKILRDKKLLKILDVFEKEKSILAFKQKITTNSVKFYISAIFFLKFKAELSEKERLENTEIFKFCSFILDDGKYCNELKLAVALLGAFFGYGKLYDSYYANSDMIIFKHKNNEDLSIQNYPIHRNEPETIESTERINKNVQITSEIEQPTKPELVSQIERLSATYGSKISGETLKGLKEILGSMMKGTKLNVTTISDYINTNYEGFLAVENKKIGPPRLFK